jgi:hypothetical protein
MEVVLSAILYQEVYTGIVILILNEYILNLGVIWIRAYIIAFIRPTWTGLIIHVFAVYIILNEHQPLKSLHYTMTMLIIQIAG